LNPKGRTLRTQLIRAGKTKRVDHKQEEYEVENIIEERFNEDTGTKEYFVKWKGYTSKDNTWEPEDHLANSPDILRE